MTLFTVIAVTCALLINSVSTASCLPVDSDIIGKDFIQFSGSGCYGRPSGVKTWDIIFTRHGLRYTRRNPRRRCARVVLFPYGANGNGPIKISRCGLVRFINARNKRYARIISSTIIRIRRMRDARCGGKKLVPKFFDYLEFEQFLENQAISNAAISHLYALAYAKKICIRTPPTVTFP